MYMIKRHSYTNGVKWHDLRSHMIWSYKYLPRVSKAVLLVGPAKDGKIGKLHIAVG